MNIFFKAILALFLIFATLNKASAMLADGERDKKRFKEVSITSFSNYPPFGFLEDEGRTSSFNSFLKGYMEDYANENNIQIIYKISDNYSNSIRDVRAGKIDLVLGIYSETEIYNGLEYIYPSIANNPIYIITLPERIDEIKDVKDLPNLKGASHKNEHWSDFVERQTKSLKIEKIDTSYDLFKKLFNKEIDYIIGGRYFYMVEASKLGLLNKISFSKNAIWDMPLFIGLSKSYRDRAYISQTLSKKLRNPKNSEKINNYLIEMMNNIEKTNQGIVSPDFSKTND